MPFKIANFATGPDPAGWDTLEDLLSVEPDWTYQPYAEVVNTLGGSGYGRGFASATWHLNIAHNAQRATLRAFCPGVSAQVYISTPINEDDSNEDPIFKNFLCTMNWMKGQEDKQIRSTLGIELAFTHLVEIDEVIV